MHKLTTLQNGLKVVTVNMPYMESVALGIWIRSGGRYENLNNNGISHFLEHMVFKGTKTKSGKDIKEAIEGIGGTLNGFTSEECTCYFVKLTNKHVDLGLDILSDMVLNPRLDKADIEKERNVILEEIKMYMDLPNHYVHDLLSKLMWPDHPLGMNLTGTFDTVKRIKDKDLIAFKEKFYSPGNIVVSCAGRLASDAIIDSVNKHFTKAGKKEQPQAKKVTRRQLKFKTHYLYKDTEQTHLAIGFHGLSIFHPDRYAIDLIHVILGGNMSSRLFHEVREKRGLAYDISTSTKHYNDTGAFIISAGINNKELLEAMDVIIKELNKIKEKKIKIDEFIRAKEFSRGQLLMALENTLSHMSWIGEKAITDDPLDNIDTVLKNLDKVTIDDIISVAKYTFKKSNLSMALIGPAKEKTKTDIQNKFDERFN